MKKIFFFILIALSIFLILTSTVSAITVISTWSDGNQDATIKNTESKNFDVSMGTANKPIKIDIKLYNSQNNLIYTFENNRVIDLKFFSHTYTVNKNAYVSKGSYIVQVKGTDGAGSIRTATLNLQVNNNAPVLAPIGNKQISENSLLEITVSATDADGDSLTYSASNLPSGASFSGQIFSWTPNFNQAGSYQTTFSVSDGTDTNSETITITVNNVNRNPSINSIPNQQVDENTAFTYQVVASDLDGDVLTYSLSGAPSGFAISSTGLITGTSPLVTTDTNYSITAIVTDSGNLTAQTTFTLTVLEIGVDTIAPLINITFPLNGDQVSGNEFIVFSDNEITNPQCSIDNSTWIACASGVTIINNLPGFTALANGTVFTLYVRDTDVAGNVGTDTETGIVKNINATDTNAPTVVITSPSNIEYDSNITILNYTAVDAEGNLFQCWFSTDLGVTNSTATSCTGSFSINSVEGINRWTVYASDLFGNIGSDLATFRVVTEDDDDSDSSSKKVTYVYDDPDKDKYTSQVAGTGSVIDLTTPKIPEKGFFTRFIEAIANFFRWLFS
ncbi:hypothetical protein HYT25_02475 [Candidatus Pacearchaeota archaeon]|nr:hypothetical protein [Candidatus Pacearchaeota archaeon]